MNSDEKPLFFTEIKSHIKPVSQITLFKIFGKESFDFNECQYESKVDWSGFYTQLTPQHSMRYLTKKWGDGAQMACLIRLFITNFHLKMLTVEHAALSNFKISGEVKAQNIKRHLKIKYEGYGNIEDQKLLKYLGSHQTLLSCVDSQDQQVIIPHQLLNQNNFRFEHIASFKRSNDGMLRTVAFNKGQKWQKVPPDVQFEPYLLLNQKVWKEL